ncbi:MAG: aminopeptidase [Pseudomonadota bacterium]
MLLVTAVVLQLTGCYYLQAARGQAQLTFGKRPVAAVIDNPDTDSRLRAQLELTQQALEFAHSELALPDNGSYRQYVDLERGYLVVNVFATAPFSLEPKRWCYPFVGCLAYRGYFSQSAAMQKAQALSDQGLDVATAPIPAYSTLGKLRDPVLSTMLSRSDDALVSLLFHELAHQLFYVRDDTAFNESFASFVAAEGLRRWRAKRGVAVDDSAELAVRRALRERLLARVDTLRDQLSALYAMAITDDEKTARKAALFDEFADDWRSLGARSKPASNNADLLPLSLYNDLTPAFAQLLSDCDGALPCLYEQAEQLADMPADERDLAVARLIERESS